MLPQTATHTNHSVIAAYGQQYRNELIQNILPFWIQNSIDAENGGFYTCLDREGKVFDTDKFVWLQGRNVWCFSTMHQLIEPREEWKQAAIQGAQFLEKFGRNEQGDWYFSLTAEGKPLVQAYNIFSDCFAAMAFSGMYKMTGEENYKTLALTTFENILRRQHNTKGSYNKAYPGTRPLKNFSLPMILCNLSLEMEALLGKERVDELARKVIAEVMDVFYQPATGLILENVNPDGSFADCFEGRLINPGHAIEAMWFIMDLGKRFDDQPLIDKACGIMLQMLDYGWDTAHEGIFYFLDVKGHPPQQLEWDQKLWWVHVEALVALAKGYALTSNDACLQWFHKIHKYTWEKFTDAEHGEWYGYLNRRGEVLLPLKGGKWKGCFHIPRALYQVQKTFAEMLPKANGHAA